MNKERQTLAVICRLLRDDPYLQARLAMPDRTSCLVNDIKADAQRTVLAKGHLRRKQIEIRNAMDHLGIKHAYGGRPVPGRPERWNRDQAIEAVDMYIRSNPYANDIHISTDEIATHIDEEYFEVDPWPMAALTS